MSDSSVTPWTVAHQVPSVHGISQMRILEWVAISFSTGSFWPRDPTHIFCIGRQVLYYWATREAQILGEIFIFKLCCCCFVVKSCLTLLWSRELWPTRLICPWDLSGKNTGVGCHFLLHGIFLIQGSNPYLLHWQAGSSLLSHEGSLYLNYTL